MTYTQVKYSPTPMLGWRDMDFYQLDTYAVGPVVDLTKDDADELAAYLNFLQPPPYQVKKVSPVGYLYCGGKLYSAYGGVVTVLRKLGLDVESYKNWRKSENESNG